MYQVQKNVKNEGKGSIFHANYILYLYIIRIFAKKMRCFVLRSANVTGRKRANKQQINNERIMKKFYAIALALLMGASANCMAQSKNVYLSTSTKMDFTKVTTQTSSVYLNRILFAGYNTICLPFSVSAADVQSLVGEGVMLEKLVKVENDKLTFLDVTDQGIEAGVPYLIYSPKEQTVKFQTNDLNLCVQPTALTVGGVTMTGKYEPTKEVDLFGIPAQQETDLLQSILIRTVADKTFLPTRCAIIAPQCTEGVPTIVHVTSLNNDATAIEVLKANNAKVSVYGVNGTLVQKNVRINDAMNTLAPGIYVVNGQKFMVK